MTISIISADVLSVCGKYGQNWVQEIRRLELQNVKLAQTRNHLKFNLRCKQLDIIPASLILACPIKTQRARYIVDRANRGLLRGGIWTNVLKIRYLKRDISERQKVFLPSEQQEQVTDLVTKSRDCMFMEVKSRHVKAPVPHRVLTHFGLQNIFLAILSNDHFLFLVLLNLKF